MKQSEKPSFTYWWNSDPILGSLAPESTDYKYHHVMVNFLGSVWLGCITQLFKQILIEVLSWKYSVEMFDNCSELTLNKLIMFWFLSNQLTCLKSKKIRNSTWKLQHKLLTVFPGYWPILQILGFSAVWISNLPDPTIREPVLWKKIS